MREELLKEFENLYRSPSKKPLKNTDGIIILSGETEPKEEDVSRIRCGLEVLKTIGYEVPIIFNGVTESREKEIASMEHIGIPKHLSHFQDCGKNGVANTKTQFEILTSDPLTKNFRNLAIVTSTYHLPRVERTAGKLLPKETNFVVISDPEDWYFYNTFLKVIDEIKKIIEYSAQGDILERPR